MKALLLLCALALPVACVAQETIADEKGQKEIVLVVPAAGTQDELFLRGKAWLFKTFNSGKAVEQFEDKPAGHIAAHARTMTLRWKAGLGIVNDAGNFYYEISLDCKENKSRITISNIVYERGVTPRSMVLKSGASLWDEYPQNWPTLGKKAMLEHWHEIQETTTSELMAMETLFQSAMQAKPKDF